MKEGMRLFLGIFSGDLPSIRYFFSSWEASMGSLGARLVWSAPAVTLDDDRLLKNTLKKRVDDWDIFPL